MERRTSGNCGALYFQYILIIIIIIILVEINSYVSTSDVFIDVITDVFPSDFTR